MNRFIFMKIFSLPVLFFLLMIVTLILTVLILERKPSSDNLLSRTKDNPGSELVENPLRGSARDREAGTVRSQTTSQANAREDLLGRWRNYVQRDIHEAIEDRAVLAAETLERLSFSEELFDLVRQLDEGGIFNTVDSEIHKLFVSAEAPDIRRRFLEIAHNANLSEAQKQKWGDLIGQTCPPGEFDEYYVALSEASPETAAWAKLSYLAEGYQDSPMKNLREMLKLEDILPSSRASFRELQITEAIRNHTDASVIDEMRDFIQEIEDNGGKSAFLWEPWISAWAKVDPVSAANHLIDHPERYSASSLAEVISKGFSNWNIKNDPHELAKWTESFPEGPYRDVALKYAVNFFRSEDFESAKMLAEKINDSQLRFELLTSIEQLEKHGPDQN